MFYYYRKALGLYASSWVKRLLIVCVCFFIGGAADVVHGTKMGWAWRGLGIFNFLWLLWDIHETADMLKTVAELARKFSRYCPK